MNNKEYKIYDLKINNFIKLNNEKLAHVNKEIESDEKKLKKYQSFITNWLSYNTKNKSLLVKHDTGLGKTFSSVSTAFQYIEIYKKLYISDRNSYKYPYIHVISFTRENFYNELIFNPKFGYITYKELDLLYKYRQEYENNKTTLNKSNYDNFYVSIKKRVTDKNNDGFFNFYGYGELFNKLFIFNEDSLELIQNDILKNKTTIINKTDIDFDILIKSIESGYIQLNIDILETFRDSFIICDEIHNVYNSVSLNNYGNALKYIMYHYRNDNIKLLLLSATPINNKPTEIIDLLNILIPQNTIKYFNNKYFNNNSYTLLKKDFFDGIILKNKINHILGEMVNGYISYSTTEDNPNVPSYKFIGSTILGINYLKFIKCETSKANAIFEKEHKSSNPLNISSISDIIFPKNVIDSKDLLIKFKPVEGSKIKPRTDYYLKTTKTYNILGGTYLKYNNLKKYSPKYYEMLTMIYDNLKNNKGKIFISHQYVNFFGILLIKEILIQNGFIMDGMPNNETPCSMCGIHMKDHKKIISHKFIETRFLLLYGDIDLRKRNEIINNKFNNKNNIHGYNYRILLGSKFTNEGIDLKAVQQLYIMSIPVDIPTLIQIMGRGIRTMSHIMLPKNKRNVDIFIFINTYMGKILNEGNQYKVKMNTYSEILKVDKILNENAVDSSINFVNTESIKSLKYTPNKKINTTDIGKINYYYYRNKEFQIISYIIKKLFMYHSPVYTHDDLIKSIKVPPFPIDYNTTLFSYDNIKVVLNKFLSINEEFYNINILNDNYEYNLINDNYYIQYDTKKYKLVCIDNIYIISEIIDININNTITFKSDHMEIYGYYNGGTKPMFYKYNIDKQIQEKSKKYIEIKYQFYNKYKDVNPLYFPTSFRYFNLEFHKKLIRDVIEYLFYLLTNPKYKATEIHNFYLKCIYFYTSINVIIYANQVRNTDIYKSYSKYITKSDIIFGLKNNIKNNYYLKEDMVNNPFLVKTLLNSEMFSDTFNLEDYNKFIGKFNSSILNATKSSNLITMNDFDKSHSYEYASINKVFDTILPIGYFIEDTYLFNPSKSNIWHKEEVFKVENNFNIPEKLNIIYGIYDYTNTNLGLIFKIVNDIKDYKNDKRYKKTGINCRSLSKKKLTEITKQLNISKSNNIDCLCNNIELYLIKQQLIEDRKISKLGSKATERIRYIYMVYEK